MPKASRRRMRRDPGKEREAKKRSLAEDRTVMFAAFENEKIQSEAKLDRVYDNVVESSMEESSNPPSPLLHRPYIPDELADRADVRAAFQNAMLQSEADINRRSDLFTLDRYSTRSCLTKDRRLLHIRESAKDAVLLAANSVISLSSYLDDEPLNKCCGLWIQRDDKEKTAIVLTSAHLIRANRTTDPKKLNKWFFEWTGKYHRDASVTVHFLDGTTALANLIYLQEHYEFALYEVVVDKPVQLSTFNDNVHSGQDVLRLGRDESLDLSITHGRVDYRFPSSYERCHYMYFIHDGPDLVHDDGGPVIDLEGKVVGMVHNQSVESFLPSSILHKCLDLWRKLKCVPRPHPGMTFISIKLLDPICTERMRRKHNIQSGLVVEAVSKESNAEKLGIRMGDVIESFNGVYISTTIEVGSKLEKEYIYRQGMESIFLLHFMLLAFVTCQLEKMLLDIGGDHFHQAKVLDAEVDIRIQIFRATELCRRARNLTVIVSDCGEDIIEGTYPITVGFGNEIN